MRAVSRAQPILAARGGSVKASSSRPAAAPSGPARAGKVVCAVRVVNNREGGAGVLDRPDTLIAPPGRESEFDLE